MDSLPPEIKLNIFNQLSIRDSIKCRQVCKDWLANIDCLRYKSLDFYVSSKGKNNGIDIDLWIINFEKFFRSVTNEPKFSRIKVMNAKGCLNDVENLDVFINHFHWLEELNLWEALNDEKFVLNLKFLKKIKFIYSLNEVKLETPSLTHLLTEGLSKFEICYPDQIKCLVAKNTLYLTKFKNLEVLIIMDYLNQTTISQLSSDLLRRLPQLKRVYVGYQWENFENRLDQIPIDRSSELQVYYCGFRIYSDLFGNFDWTNIKNLYDPHGLWSNINLNMLEWTSFIARNYSKSMDDNPYYFHLDYTCLLDEFDQNIPNDFLKKISKVNLIKIKNLDDDMKISKFLDSTKPPLVLIENPTLSRSFLEQLTKFSFIQYLRIRIDEWPAFLDDFNFNFKNEKIRFIFEIHCSLKSLRPVFEVLERASSITLHLDIFCDEFGFSLYYSSSGSRRLSIDYTMNGERISTSCTIESLDFCFNLDRLVPSIVKLEDKLRLISIVKKYEAQKKWKKNLKCFAVFLILVCLFYYFFKLMLILSMSAIGLLLLLIIILIIRDVIHY